MLDSVNESIDAAVGAGKVDPRAHAAPLEALRRLAARADEADSRDNVTFPTMLRYMEALGMLPQPPQEGSKPAAPPRETALSQARGSLGLYRGGRRAC